MFQLSPICSNILCQPALHVQDFFNGAWLAYDGFKERNSPGAGLKPYTPGQSRKQIYWRTFQNNYPQTKFKPNPTETVLFASFNQQMEWVFAPLYSYLSDTRMATKRDSNCS